MANVMLKCVRFAQILNRRSSFSSVKYYRGLYFSRSYTNLKFRKNYATAAYKLDLHEDLSIKNNDPMSRIDGKDIQSIDAALNKIDSLIRRNGRTQLKNINKIFSSITSKESTSSVHALYLLRACKYCTDEPPSKRINMVNEIWNKYQELGIEFDVKHYNAMLDVHVTNNLDFNPVDILASMEGLKIEPNKDTYMLIMKKYCQDGNISGASEILEYMKEKQMTADEKVFNYLIEAHVNNNDLAGAKEMVEVMKASSLEPTAETHCILACGYAANGDKEKMMSHLKECKDSNNVGYHLKVIQALASSGNQQLIDDVIALIEYNEWHHQQAIINGAVELIHKNFIDVAYKLATLICTLNYKEGVNIFIKQLVKSGSDPSEVVKYCERIKKEDPDSNIYLIAAKVYAECDNISQTVQFFQKIQKEMGYNIRPSSFWPLFSSAKENSKEGCWSILKTMTELGVPSDFKTYIDIVYPTLGVPKPREVLHGIKHSGQAADLAADALFVYYCNIGKLDYALELTEAFPVSLSSRFDVENFVKLYEDISAENLPIYYKLLKYIFMEGSKFPFKCDIDGRLLAELIVHKKRLLEILLDKYKDLKFSDYALHICEQELISRNPPQLAILRKIKVLNAEREGMVKHENLSDRDEDEYISRLQAENLSCRSFLIQRINHHIKMKNNVRLQQLLATFDEMKLEYTPLMLSNLFGLWCTVSDLEKANEFLDKLKTNFPDFNVDLPKAIDYVTLLIKYEKFDESYEALKEFLSKPHHYGNKDAVLKSIRRFNTSLSNSQDAEFVKKMQNLMLSLSKDFGPKKLLDPSVNVYLQRGDLKSALEEFKKIVITHRVPACLNLFFKKCINSNEKDILQQVVDLTISCTNKSFALLELAVAMIETYHTQNAVKVIENIGSEADPVVLESICERLCHQNRLNELEELIKITESLNHIDRESLYIHAFRACANRNDFQRALQLFETMKAEVIHPTPETIKLLQKLFKENNQPVPVSLMSGGTSEISTSATEATKTFFEQLEAGNIENALKELSSLKKGFIRTLSIKTLTELVDLCLQKNCTQELSSNVHTMSYILDNVKDVLKPILEKYSLNGDTEKFSLLLSFIPDFALMNVGFNAHFCRAFISCGKYDALLSLLEERITQKNKLFSAIAFEELLKFPEYEERIFNLAVKYLDFNYNLPIAVVWAHYFSKENHEKAEEIYKRFSINFDRVDNIILRNIKQNENVDLAKKYVDFIKDTNVRSRVKERAYGAAADLLVFKGMYDEATTLVVDAERQNLELHKYYLSTLVTLKSILEKENKPVPFKIPLDGSTASDSNLE